MAARANTSPGHPGRGGQSSERLAALTHALRPLDQVVAALSGRYLIKGLLDRGSLSCIFGPPNGGKSFVVLDLAAHVAAGRKWHGHRVATGGPVIYITAEGGAAFGNRIAALRSSDPGLVEQATQAGMAILPVALDLCRGDDATHLLDLIEGATDAPPVLIVIDTLARSMGEGNENDVNRAGFAGGSNS